LATLQEKLAVLPGYALPSAGETSGDGRLGTSLSGVVGGLVTLALCLVIGVLLRQRPRKD
jgi:cobalt/nickel transport system permease protein